jgi:glycine cleavage system H protein
MKREVRLSKVKQAMSLTGVFLALIVALPILAILAFMFRTAFFILIPVALLAMSLSPAFRKWLSLEGEERAPRGARLPAAILVHPFHSWARFEKSGEAVAGVDDLVQCALGPVEEVELPRIGDHATEGTPLFRLRSGDRALLIRSPVSGRVVRVNSLLAQAPGLVNDGPYGSGWAVGLESDDSRASRAKLRSGAAARTWLRKELERLIAAATPTTLPTPALQDGGVLVENFHLFLDGDVWTRVQQQFFGAEVSDSEHRV